MGKKLLVVTRHGGLIDFLREEGVIDGECDVVAHASVDQIRGRHVVGVLPLHLAAHCASVTVVPLNLPPELRGVELSSTQVRAHAGAIETYTVSIAPKPY